MLKKILIFIFIFLNSLLFSQENQQEKLERRKAKIQQEIKENENKLQSVKSKEKIITEVIVLQSNKIKLKENLINTTEKQTKLLSNNIETNQSKIKKLENDLALLKVDYANMIVKSYKSRSEQSKVMFVLSSKNFIQAYKRFQYMKQYSQFRKLQGEIIIQKSVELTTYHQKLNTQKEAKEKLIEENEKERLSLENEKHEQETLAKELKAEKIKIAQNIKKKQQEAKNIDKQIDRLIRQAIAEANRKAAKEKLAREKLAKEKALADKILAQKEALEKNKIENDKTVVLNSNTKSKPVNISKKTKEKELDKIVEIKEPVSTTKMDLTPDVKLSSDNFRANKGSLPWPVERGTISLNFGDQSHPVYKDLVIHNSGLEITTETNAHARAVFQGEVTSVFILSPVNKAVMIQHGEYFTVYQNLSSVNVSKGEKINGKQILGKIRTNSEGKTILKFTLSQNTNYTDPKPWLAKF